MKTKLIAQKYKTYEGAHKRAAFERSVNPGEHARGDVAHLYLYSVMREPDGIYRVTKTRVTKTRKEGGI